MRNIELMYTITLGQSWIGSPGTKSYTLEFGDSNDNSLLDILPDNETIRIICNL